MPQLHLCLEEAFCDLLHCFHHLNLAHLVSLWYQNGSGLFGFSVVDEEVLGSAVVVVVDVVSSSLPLWFPGSSGVVSGVSGVVGTVVLGSSEVVERSL